MTHFPLGLHPFWCMGPLFLDCLWLFYLCPLTFSTSAFGACASWGPPSVKAILVYVVGLDRVVFRGALHLLWSFILGLGGGHMRFGHEDGLPSSCPQNQVVETSFWRAFLHPWRRQSSRNFSKRLSAKALPRIWCWQLKHWQRRKTCAKEITSVCTLKDRNLFWKGRWALESFGAKKKSLRHAAVVNTCCVMRKMLSKPADVKDLQILEKNSIALLRLCAPYELWCFPAQQPQLRAVFWMIGSTIYKDLKRENPSLGK